MEQPGDKNKILFFNPRSALNNHRLPLSLLQVCAAVHGRFGSVLLDANLEGDPWRKIETYLETGEFSYFACSVMPGPQLKQAIPFTKRVKNRFPGITTIWGGYFPSIHPAVVISSGYVDFVIYGPGDVAFPMLMDCLIEGRYDKLPEIGNLVFMGAEKKVVKTASGPLPDQGNIKPLPYDHLSAFYDIDHYIARTFLGNRTFTINTSLGCPYHCSFCGVASVFHASWSGRPAQDIFREVIDFREKYRIDSVEIIDSNFFSSRERVLEFCRLIQGARINWWAEGRIDMLSRFTDDELARLKEAGCRLVFMGAESGDDEVLKQVDKGGSMNSGMTKELVKRFRKAGIIPQLSFVLGLPAGTPAESFSRLKNEISFIRSLKRIYPGTEIIPYLYSPVPGEGSQLGARASELGLSFPEALQDWLGPEWEEADLRKNPNTPWLEPRIVSHVRDFETVMTAAFPGITNFRIRGVRRLLLQAPGKLRYWLRWYRYPLELRFLLKLLRYRRPEKEGFYRE